MFFILLENMGYHQNSKIRKNKISNYEKQIDKSKT